MAEGRNYILRAISPVVAISCSESVEKMISNSNFDSFTNLISPLGFNLDPITITDTTGNSILVDPCSLRFVEESLLKSLDLQKLDQQMIEEVLPFYGDFQDIPAQTDGNNEGNIAKDAHTLPWFERYKSVICNWTGTSEHETFNHPVARKIE